MKYLTNSDGLPTKDDFYSSGSEVTAKNAITTPDGLMSFIPGPALNIHQNQSDTKPVGTSGSTYVPHPEDEIIRTISGHTIIYGNAPGNETLRIQSSKNSCIELSSDGAIKIASDGLQMSIHGNKEIIVAGECTIVSTGEMKFKSPKIVFDTNEMVNIIRGNKHEVIDGNYQQDIKGSRNITITENDNLLTSGSYRVTIGTDYRQQVSGNYKLEIAGNYDNLVKGEYYTGVIDDATLVSNKSVFTTAIEKIENVSGGNHLISSGNNINIITNNDMNLSSKAGSILANVAENITTYSKYFNRNTSKAIADASESYTKRTKYMSEDSSAAGALNIKTTGAFYLDAEFIYFNETDTAVTSQTPDAPVTLQFSSTTSAKRPELPPKQLLQDFVTDANATSGQVKTIWNAEQIEFDFIESSSSSVPTDILTRMEQKGILYIQPKTEYISSINTNNINILYGE